MADMEALLRRIDRLEARHEIAELIAAYGIACDDHDIARLRTLFTESARLTTPNGLMAAHGLDEIIEMFRRVLRTRGPSFHWSHDHHVGFDDDDSDRAEGLVLSHAETSPEGEVSLAAMRYVDEYRRADGRWRFESRAIHFLYYMPVGEYATVLNGPNRMHVGGEPRAADYPEALPAWRDFFAAAG